MHASLRHLNGYSGYESPAKTKKFHVEVIHKSNGLHGSVEVYSTDAARAADFATETFFRGGNWKVTSSVRI